jgi:hypothetical protein
VYTRGSDSQAWTDQDGRYAYDESGQLIGSSRSVVGSKNFFRAEEIVWLDNTPVARIVIVPSQGVAEKGPAAVIEVHAIHTDHLNSPRAPVLARAAPSGPREPSTDRSPEEVATETTRSFLQGGLSDHGT